MALYGLYAPGPGVKAKLWIDPFFEPILIFGPTFNYITNYMTFIK